MVASMKSALTPIDDETPHSAVERLLTVREVGDRLGISISLVYALCAKRQLGHIRLGLSRGTIRISEGDLSTILSCRRAPAIAPTATAQKKSFTTLDQTRLAAAWHRRR